MEQYKEIAPRLIGLREGIGWTVKEMADLLGLPEEKVAAYESGTVEIPVGYMLDVSRLCRVDLTTLISGREPHLKSYSLVRKDEGFPSIAARITTTKALVTSSQAEKWSRF